MTVQKYVMMDPESGQVPGAMYMVVGYEPQFKL